MVKFNFEFLLIPEESSKPVATFWQMFGKNRKFTSFRDNKTIYFKITENDKLKFNVSINSLNNRVMCNIVAQTDVHWRKVHYYDEFRNEIKSLLNSKYEVTLLTRELSRYYSQKCRPMIEDYEYNLRKVFYLLYHFKDMSDINKSLNKKNIKKGKLNAFVEDLNLSELERMFFSKVWLLKEDGNYEFCDTTGGTKIIELLEKLPGKPHFKSTWELFIDKIIEIDSIDQKSIESIREIRNKLSHNKEMSFENLEYCRTVVQSVSNTLERIPTKIIFEEIRTGIDVVSFKESFSVLSDILKDMRENNISTIHRIVEPIQKITMQWNSLKLVTSPDIISSVHKNNQLFNNSYKSTFVDFVNQGDAMNSMFKRNLTSAVPSLHSFNKILTDMTANKFLVSFKQAQENSKTWNYNSLGMITSASKFEETIRANNNGLQRMIAQQNISLRSVSRMANPAPGMRNWIHKNMSG